ncbi:putative Gibberellin 2-beta-dioxygenase 7 [Glarea lozoyensis 74030]|uniref:Putative Gibberellin 2-beta-dioxygenase 7 n=1 Tax=Glarea lozoyensis (strain ATCC 74030 / MF5533) TaxID=1104152 RepID=H0ERV4_GLAL7|nr:putative Gibberellin 2-beta-dioxygenase 7 [Glarea lozoyensis 74030]
MDEKEKNNYDIDTIAPWKLHGHTPAGRNSGLAGAGEKHGVEAYTIRAETVWEVVRASLHRNTGRLSLQRLAYYLSGLAPHTDVGSLTVLFADKRGLQARHPDTGEWQYLEPREGCAVINIGDSLRFMSQKNFQSALHRVIPTPGTTIHDRFSCAYFLRPELDAEFDAEGQHWKSIDWHLRKYKSYRSGQTGKTE